MKNSHHQTSAHGSNENLKNRAESDQKLNRFAIITAYSIAVLIAMGYGPGIDVILGLGL